MCIMKHLLTALAVIMAPLLVFSQSSLHNFHQTKYVESSNGSLTISIYKFESVNSISASMATEILQELTQKDEIKSVMIENSNKTITIKVVKGISIHDLNNVLSTVGVFLTDNNTPKERLDKINYESKMN